MATSLYNDNSMMTATDRSDPQLQQLWSPMSTQGQSRFQLARAAIRARYGGANAPQPPVFVTAPPPGYGSCAVHTEQREVRVRATDAQSLRLQQRIARAAKKSLEEIFFQSFGQPEQLVKTKYEFMRKDAFTGRSARALASTSTLSQRSASTHRLSQLDNQLALPARTSTPKRFSLKRSRVDDASIPSDTGNSSGSCVSPEETSPIHLVDRRPLQRARTTLGDTTNLVHAANNSSTQLYSWQQRRDQVLASRHSSTITSVSAGLDKPAARESYLLAMKARVLVAEGDARGTSAFESRAPSSASAYRAPLRSSASAGGASTSLWPKPPLPPRLGAYTPSTISTRAFALR